MTTDCMRNGLSCRSAAIDGSAVLTIVESSICMKTPSATSQSNRFGERSSFNRDIDFPGMAGIGKIVAAASLAGGECHRTPSALAQQPMLDRLGLFPECYAGFNMSPRERGGMIVDRARDVAGASAVRLTGRRDAGSSLGISNETIGSFSRRSLRDM